MNWDIYSQAEQLNKKRRRKRAWYKILSVPICLVVFVTTYALILPAITMESTPDTYCGKAEHVHTDDCYEVPGTPAHKEIQCTAGADLGPGEYIIHHHDSFCFDDSGELLCTLTEQDEHVHTDACYDGDNLICGLVTGIVHQHTADCVISVPATEPQGLVCTVEEHKHTEACFMNPEDEASSGETGDDVPADKTPASDVPADKPPASDVPTGGDPSNETPGGDVPTDAAQGGNVPGDTVQSTDAANDDTPEDDAAVNSPPVRALAASGSITDVHITINDKVSDSGYYEAAVNGGDAALDGKKVQYQWYKSTNDGATYTPVEAKNFTAGGKTVSNIRGDHGEQLFPALDGGTVSDTQPSVKYKAVLKVDDTVYDSVSAVCINTTHQASVLNGSFEAPNLTDYWFQQFVPEGTPGLFWKTTASNEEGGQAIYPSVAEKEKTTGTNDREHYIEIIDTGTPDHKDKAAYHHQQGTATDGKQYAEINAGAAGALYQTIATIPGTTMYWSVDHSGREGTDTMAVVMMPESSAKSIITQAQLLEVLKNPNNYGATVVSNLSAPKGVWITHSGQYTIPEGQYETRFFFMAVSTYNDKNYIGNHIDNVWFSQQIPPTSSEEPYFTLTKHVVGLTEDDLQQLSGKLTFTVQKSADSNFTNPETVMTYTATNSGSWTRNGDGSWTLSARISMKNQERGNYYRIVESGAELDGFKLTATAELDGIDLTTKGTNAAVLLQSTTVADFTFTNTYVDTGRALTLKKIVSAPDTTGSFTFTVSYTDAGGNPQTESVILKNDKSKTITGIAKGKQVTVTETTTDGYTVSMKDHSTGADLAGSSSYTFTMNNDTAVDIYNTSSVALPETGGIGRGIFLFAGIGLMLTAVIAGCLLRRKYGKGGE